MIQAKFKPDGELDGEEVGPLILWDPDDADFHEELERMSLAQARKLAEMNRWPLAVEA